MLGSKIENLIILSKHNINVPKFIFITQDECLEHQIDYSQIDSLSIKEQSDLLKSQIKELFCYKYNAIHSNKLYAVRSSCNLEDNDKTSFAGQFDTFLFVNEKDIENKVLLCFQSLYNENVLEYIKTQDIKISSLQMNVIIQEMIDADFSGVLFTSNPQGILNEMVISVAKGIGENVVQDKGIATNYYYNITDNVYYFDGESLIDNNIVEQLIRVAKEIQVIFGEYLDIEFAIKDNKLYILQCRPITTINGSNPLILDNSNIVESYPGISLPLTISFVHSIYSSVFEGVSRRILKDEKELVKHKDAFKNMTGNVNGRIYYKISNWYTLIKFLPMSDKIIPIWQDMLGVKTKGYDKSIVNLTLYQRIRTYINFIYEFLNTPKNMKKLKNEFKKIYKYFKDNYNENLTNQEVLSLYKMLEQEILLNWDITLVNDMYAFIFTGLLKKVLTKKHKPEEVNQMISGISNIESLKPIKALLELSLKIARKKEENFTLLKENYIELYGDRIVEELKLETRTFRTNPELLDENINEYISDIKKLETMYNSLNSLKDNVIPSGIIINFLKNRCTEGIMNRELSRLDRTRIFGMVRTMFLHIGKNFELSGIIATQRDIFYLTIEEIFDIVTQNKVDNMQNLVQQRKNDYKVFEKLPTYSRVIFEHQEFDKLSSNVRLYNKIENNNELFGTPCSIGHVMGEVVVVTNPNENKNVKDKIIVTKMTDPGWVFLITEAKGILTEKGSLLSHTAIISRELHIPSIVGIDNLLLNLNDGDIIEMDGTIGKVVVQKRKKEEEKEC